MPSRLHHLPRQLQLQLLPHRRTLSSSRHLLRWLATPLPHRSLIRLTGPESESFLQGLVTNDVSKAQQPFVAPEDAGIEGKGKALATAFLNAPGRTLFDAFVLPLPALSSSPGGQANGGYWIDHPRFLDPTCLPTTTDPPPTDGKPPDGTKALWLHLRRYILRTKVHLALEPSKPTPSDPAFSIWAVFDPDWASRLRATPGVKNQGSVSVQGQVVDEAKEAVQAVLPDQEQKEAAKEKQQYEDEENKVLGQLLEQAGVKVWRDDRAPGMGFRVLVPSTLPSFPPAGVEATSPASHTLHSVLASLPPSIVPSPSLLAPPPPSSSTDPPSEPSNSIPNLPLELCLDYSGAVDFRKGCYVGQELTARTKWRGVVRKRLAALTFAPPSRTLEQAPEEKDGEWEPLSAKETADLGLPNLPAAGSDLFPLVQPSSSPSPSDPDANEITSPTTRRRSSRPRSHGKLLGPVLYSRLASDPSKVRAVGLGVVRTETLEEEDGLKVVETGGEGKEEAWTAKGKRPGWWPDERL